MPVKVKICGITNIEDAILAVASGASAIGLIFTPNSPRALNAAKARLIVDNMPPFVAKVGVFVDLPAAELAQVLEQAALDVLQFHGDEDPEYCQSFGKPYIKAIRMQPGLDIRALEQAHKAASGILLDTYHPERQGGVGEQFDWGLVPAGLEKPIILAGGLNPDNVAEAVRQVRPYAVDVSSGVESSPGKKDASLVKSFIKRAIAED